MGHCLGDGPVSPSQPACEVRRLPWGQCLLESYVGSLSEQGLMKIAGGIQEVWNKRTFLLAAAPPWVQQGLISRDAWFSLSCLSPSVQTNPTETPQAHAVNSLCLQEPWPFLCPIVMMK